MIVEGRLHMTVMLASNRERRRLSEKLYDLKFKRGGKAHHSLVPHRPTLIEAGIVDLTSIHISSVKLHFRVLR